MKTIVRYIFLIIIIATSVITKTEAQNVTITLGYNYDSTTNIIKGECQAKDTTKIKKQTNLPANELYDFSETENLNSEKKNQIYPLIELNSFYIRNRLFTTTKTQYTYVLFIVLVNYIIT